MELMDVILSKENIEMAVTAVKRNKGAAGIDKMQVGELDEYLAKNLDNIVRQIQNKVYKPQPVRRVYIPKPNGKQRPLGIPTVVDRVIQQAVSQVLMKEYDPYFSNYSYGFRPKRSAHMAIEQVLEYLNDGCEWVVDFDIEKYFDTVNHDKLISTLRERVKDDKTLHLIRSFLKAGVLDKGLVSSTTMGVPQGGPLSPILSNIYLDKLDKELESRGLRFVRYADDFDIFVRSEKSAERVMKSVSSWVERKLFLKVSATKTKVVRPTDSNFLGFTFWKSGDGWKPKPMEERKKKLKEKVKVILKRNEASSRKLSVTITKLNQVIRGWINYFRIGSMKEFLEKEFSPWLRHKVRVVIMKQWKRPRTIYRNLQILNRRFKCRMSDEEIFKVANSRDGWYKRSTGNVINFVLSPKVLALPNKKENRPGLIDPLKYYCGSTQ